MTREEVTRFFARRQEAWARLDAPALGRDHSEDCVLESPTAGTVTGREQIEEIYQAWFKAFPDLELHQDDLLIDGDRAAQILTVMGTDVGGFMGLPATGKRFRFPAVLVHRLIDHQIVHERRVYDFTGLLVQIGMLKAKPAKL